MFKSLKDGLISKKSMKTSILRTILATALVLSGQRALAQGTAFTYQGQLLNNGGLAGGSYDLAFTLFRTNTGGFALAGPATNAATTVNNRLFTVTLDFGNQFNRGAPLALKHHPPPHRRALLTPPS